MKFKRTPLKISCAGLSKKLMSELKDELFAYFFDVDIIGNDTIIADNSASIWHYNMAWNILDRYAVKVSY